MKDNLSEKVAYALGKIRESDGLGYPRNRAERESMIDWIHNDICHRMYDLDEIRKVLEYMEGETNMKQ